MKIKLVPYDQKTRCPLCHELHPSDVELYTHEGIQKVRDLVEPVRMDLAPKLDGRGDFAAYNVLCQVKDLLAQLDDFIEHKEVTDAKTS